MCDVLADGTVVGQALVEAVYDTSSGARIGTRRVDPLTGADYLPTGTLQPCPPPDSCTCETVLLCHTPPGTPIPGPDTSALPLTATGEPTTHTISGQPRQGVIADATAIWAGQTVSVPGAAAGASDPGAHTHYTVALAPGTPDCGTLDPAGDVEITATVTYTNDGPGGGWDWYGRLSLWVEGAAAPVAADNFGQGSGVFFTAGSTRTATITGTVPVAALQAGDISVEFDLETGPNGAAPEGTDPKTWTVTGATLTATAAVTGCTLGTEPADPVPFLRHICRTCTGTATVTDTTLDGTTVYDTSTGTVGVCGQESAGRQVIERCGCDQTASGIVRYVELWSVNTGNPDDEPLLLGTWLDGDFTQPYEPVSPVDCPDAGPEEVAAPIVLGHICYDDGTSIRTAAVVRCAGCDDTTVRYVDVETGAEVAAPAVVPCPGATGDPAPVCYTVPATPPVTCDTVTITAVPAPDITSALVVANPQAWPIQALETTYNGDRTASGGPNTSTGVITCDDFQGDTGVVIDYTLATPANNVTALNLFNSFGGVITDDDGIGSATLTVYDAADAVLWTGPLVTCQYATNNTDIPCTTDFGGALDGVARFRFSALAKFPPADSPAPNLGWREVELVATGYEALLTLDCGGQEVTATVEGAAAGLSYAGGQLTQTSGPHTLTWHAPAGYTGTITTDTPGAFDRLDFTDGTVITVSGDGTVTFAVQVAPPSTGGAPLVGFVTLDPVTGLPTVRDANTGQVVPDAVIVPCPSDADCASPTTPVTSVGLCLADGTPIAVTITRDCTGATVSEGWLNLTTGAWSAGAVPAGTVACGDSRSIQVSGTFCAVDAADEVVALVLVEYTYDDTGAISAVRLVDATTGATYVPPAGVTVTVCPTGTAQPEQDAVILCHTATDGTVTTFVRDYRRDETGTITGHSDYLLDGTAYTPDPTGTVGVCQPGACQDCETLLLCAEDPATITGLGVSSGTLPNGVDWQVKANITTVNSSANNADGAWWGNPASFPNVTVPAYTFTFSEPSVVEFSVYMGLISPPPEPDDNIMQLPAGLEVVSLPTGFVYDPVNGQVRVTVAQPADPTGANLANPTRAVSARFRTPGPVSTLTTRYLGPRRAIGGAFRTAWVGALEVTPSTQFLRRICRDCDGMVTGITDTLLDGTTVYDPPAEVMVCQPSQDQPPGTDTEPVLLCYTAQDGTITQFLRHITYSAETGAVTALKDTLLDGVSLFVIPTGPTAGTVGVCQPDPAPEQDAVLLCHTATDGTVTEIVRDYQRDGTGAIVGYADYTLDGTTFDTSSGTVGQCRPVDCTSTPLCVRPSGVVEFISNAENRTTGFVDPVWKWSSMSLAGPWYDMYQVGVFPGWTVTDAGTPGGTAHWVAQHPNSTVTSTGLPGEGPTLTAANPEWYARASFELPAFADPATIQVASTVLNADQLAVEWRLNAGPWQAVGRNHQPPAYTFGPAAVPGAQAGTNTIYLHGRETVFGSGGSGVMMHLIVTYDVDASAFEQWLRTTCSDGSITYLDGDGNPQTGIPADYTIVPCPGGTGGDEFDVETWPLCILDSTGAVVQQVRAEQVYDTAGVATGVPRFVDAVTGDPATVPAGGSVTVCPSSTTASGRQLVERCGCSDEDGDGIAETRYVELWSVDPEGTGAPLLVGTYVDGDFDQPITPAAPMDCPDDDTATAPPVLTGLVRVTDTNPRNLSADFPGLQSVTLTVLAGNVDVDASAFGATIPAGTSMTWSVLDGEAGPLAGWSCTGQAGADYLLAWTYTA